MQGRTVLGATVPPSGHRGREEDGDDGVSLLPAAPDLSGTLDPSRLQRPRAIPVVNLGGGGEDVVSLLHLSPAKRFTFP